MATTPKACGSGRRKAATAAPSRSGTSAISRTSPTTWRLGTRNIKVALKRLRQWARDGAAEELDLDGTIRATAEQGWLDVKTRPERRNAVKVIVFLDVGGSMDDHVKVVEELFSAAKSEFKHLEHYYFHNCLYESVWRDNRRRWTEQIPTHEVMNTYGSDYKCIFVGDAAMSPYEIAFAGGANEHWNEEAGQVWLERARAHWPDHLWINPHARAGLGLHPVDRDDRPDLRGAHGADDARGDRPGHAGIGGAERGADADGTGWGDWNCRRDTPVADVSPCDERNARHGYQETRIGRLEGHAEGGHRRGVDRNRRAERPAPTVSRPASRAKPAPTPRN